MATLQDYRDERLRKLQELKTLGVDPYPAESHRTTGAGEVASKFGELEGQTVTVAGRITGIRKFGKLAANSANWRLSCCATKAGKCSCFFVMVTLPDWTLSTASLA